MHLDYKGYMLKSKTDEDCLKSLNMVNLFYVTGI